MLIDNEFEYVNYMYYDLYYEDDFDDSDYYNNSSMQITSSS